MKINVDRSVIHYIDQGHGAPTLLLHGNPDSSEVWSGMIPALSAHMRCIAPDLPGFGLSTAPVDFDYSLDGMAAFVDRFISELGITEPLNLVVHDIGGPFGLAWVVRHPEKVRSVVVMNTVFHADYRWHLFGRLWRTPVIGEIVQALTSRSGFTRELRRASRKLSREQINRTYELITPSVKKMMLRWYRFANPRNFAGWEESLQKILRTKHSIVLWGEHDPYIQGHYADRFGAQKVERFTDSGHWLPAELSDAVASRMLRFYKEVFRS
ncbi:alpha/beta fold hydrolase [Polaromonas sp. CG_9.11]|uniref:alpha/beta fold hydrolase n=1 Tax=Polaromonas sp. CG_9.11 TaxID=2787730 RepID=UPI0018CAC581|nr:alpha/beta fold hydrolase [Polaromonas sp. CG_9.11]MBG6078103.1 pimeloyl-ACP methyl ester carboxylesterase [Polaromonas sp. CG_9.11]